MKYIIFFICVFSFSAIKSQSLPSGKSEELPRIVIGIVVDQMRWDYLYRFKDRYKEDGAFRRLLKEGFECRNVHYNYIPTVTAAGHASIYSGSIPAINGIVGNDWYDRARKKIIYCAQDDSFGSSPRNLWTTNIADEMRMAYQFKNKAFGIALKDRAAIFPAGHHPNGAFWYNAKTGNWISSSYYEKAPAWVALFNEKKRPNALYKKEWKTRYPIETYSNYIFQKATSPYYNNPFKDSSLPYTLSEYIDKDFSKIISTPLGNTLTIEFAKTLIEQERLGQKGNMPDFLAISFSSPDYIGHAFGPNSVEVEDTYLRLDEELGEFLTYLDIKFGKKNYLLLLTADHAVNHIPAFLEQHRLPGKVVRPDTIIRYANSLGEKRYEIPEIVEAAINQQLYLNLNAIEEKNLDLDNVIEYIRTHLADRFRDDLSFVVNNTRPRQSIPAALYEKVANGYCPTRSGEISLIFKSGYIPSGKRKGTSHFSPYAYDTHIPLLFYGWKIPKGKATQREIAPMDIAPTLSELLRVQMPSGSIGTPIEEIIP